MIASRVEKARVELKQRIRTENMDNKFSKSKNTVTRKVESSGECMVPL